MNTCSLFKGDDCKFLKVSKSLVKEVEITFEIYENSVEKIDSINLFLGYCDSCNNDNDNSILPVIIFRLVF